LDETNKILEEIRLLNESYNNHISNGNVYYNDKRYEEAKTEFEAAHDLKPDEDLPIRKIKELETIIKNEKAEQAKQKKFDEIVSKADVYYNAHEYSKAKTFYLQALELYPNNYQIKNKIKSIDNTLALIAKKAKDQKYANLISQADSYYRTNNYEKAKELYEQALEIYPGREDVIIRIREIDNALILIAKNKLDEDYRLLITKADAAFDRKEYVTAKQFYEQARLLKPYEQYPAIRINAINKKIDREPIVKPKEKELSELYKQSKNAVFYVITEKYNGEQYQGSGFFISSSGLAISNYHVFKGTQPGKEIIIDEYGNQFKIDKVLEKSEELDYIIFRIKKTSYKKFPYLEIANSLPETGEKVFAIGNPAGLEKSLSNGIISGYRELVNSKTDVIQTTTPITHGSSGGPLLDMEGKVIGITTFGIMEGEGNLYFAINIKKLRLYRFL
jgi:tetratricopeptide (TPR) repeat protein